MADLTTNELASLADMTPPGAGAWSPLSDGGAISQADLLQFAGTFNGAFPTVTVTLTAPTVGIGFVTLWDIPATGGPYHYSSFEPADGADAYHGRLVGNVSMVKEQTDIFNGLAGKRQAQLSISNLPVNADAPTLSQLRTSGELFGLFAPVQLVDLVSQTALFRLNGKITAFTPRRQIASAVVAIDEPKSFDTLLPKLRVVDVFPDADLSSTKVQDPVVLVAFGPWRKVQLVMCQTDLSTYWDYGPLRVAATGTASYVNIYREGALVDPTEYTIVEPVPGYLLVRFTLDQNDSSGRALTILADITSTEFAQNPAAVLKFLLTNTTYGLGETVNDVAFAVAVTDFASIPLRVGNGLSQQQTAKTIFPHLLLHGASLDRNDDGEYIETVDTLDQHPQHADADLQLGAGLEDWDNISNDPEGTLRDETQRLHELIMQAAWDPYFDGKGSYYVRAHRSRDVGGISKTIESPYLVDAASTDRQAHYLWYKNNGRDEQYGLDCIAETYVLDLGHLVKVTIDSLQLDHVVMEITKKAFKGGRDLAFSYIVAGWDPQAYSYLFDAANLQVSPFADVLTDYRRTPPATPTNFSVVGVVRYAEASLTESVATLSCDAPPVNVTHIGYIVFKNGSGVIVNQLEVACIPGETAVTGGFILEAGLDYDFDYYAINKNNDPDRQESIHGTYTGFTALGDVFPPAPPTNFLVTRGTGRNAYARWDPSIDAPKVRTYQIEWDPDPTFATPTQHEEKTTRTTISDLPYDAEIYFRVRAVSRAGLFSTWSHTQVMKIVRLLPSDYGQDTVYRYHRAPISEVVYIITVPAHESYSFDSGIDATKYEWSAGAIGVPQATDEWDSSSFDGDGNPKGTRLFDFSAGGSANQPFNPNFWIGIWNGTAVDLDPTVARAHGS